MKKTIRFIGIFVLIVAVLLVFWLVKGFIYYANIKSNFNNDDKYYAVANFYEDLTGFHKKKFNNLLKESLVDTSWVTEDTVTWTNYGNCTGYDHIKFHKNYIEHYFICGENNTRYDVEKPNYSIEFKENKDDVVIFYLGGSVNVLFFRSDSEIVATHSVLFRDNESSIVYRKFIPYDEE